MSGDLVPVKDPWADAPAVTEGQDPFPDMPDPSRVTKTKFVGMAFDHLDADPKIGDEATFTVKARCIALTDEASKRDGTIRHVAKYDVLSVVPKDGAS